MSDVWIYLKNSINCKPHSAEVHEPVRISKMKNQGKIESSNTKDERKNHSEKEQKNSPSPQGGSAMILNPVTHEIVFDDTSGEIKSCLCCPYPQINQDDPQKSTRRTTSTPSRQTTHYVDCDKCNLFSKPKVPLQKGSNDPPPASTCHRECCGKQNSVEEQDLNILENSVIQLHQEDSSWQIIEKICQTNKINSKRLAPQIECVLKVQNTQKTFASFEEYREMVMKTSADEKLQNNPRCLADGNELMRFHATTVACSLGVNNGSSNDSSNLCTLDQCGVCQILRHGFSTNQEFHGALGVLTSCTSQQAFDYTSTGSSSFYEHLMRKCVIVCRVIAGRVHNPLQEIQEITTDSGFDSLVKKVSSESDIEELFVLNPRAILPCFVVIYKS